MKRKHFIIVAVIFFAVLLYRAEALAVSTLISLLLAYLFDPVIHFLEKKKINRKLSVILIYAILLVLFISVGVKLGGNLFSRAQEFVKAIPSYIEKAEVITKTLGEEYSWLNDVIINLDTYFASSLQNFLKGAFKVASQAIYIFLIYLFSFFLLFNRDSVVASVRRFIGEKKVEEYDQLLDEVDGVLRGFFRGRLLVCLSIFILTMIGTSIIDIKHSIFISLFTGATSFIPYYGALAGLLPGLLAALGSPNIAKTAISISILIIAVNSIESNLLTPFLTAKHIKVHPGIIVFSVIAGGALFGFWGVFFSLPVAGIINVLYKHSIGDPGDE